MRSHRELLRFITDNVRKLCHVQKRGKVPAQIPSVFLVQRHEHISNENKQQLNSNQEKQRVKGWVSFLNMLRDWKCVEFRRCKQRSLNHLNDSKEEAGTGQNPQNAQQPRPVSDHVHPSICNATVCYWPKLKHTQYRKFKHTKCQMRRWC